MGKYTFLTINSLSTGELKILGSRFIGNAAPISNKDQAEEYIGKITKKYHDATHNCFAYKLVTDQEEIIRTNDDREPQGTAGKPILKTIEKKNLCNVVVVVTRYFGGKKLGKGGLMRAYRDCADITLSDAKSIQKVIYKKILLEFPYNDTGNIMKIISDFSGKINDETYEDKCRLSVEIPKCDIEKFKSKILDITGKSQISIKF